MRAESPPLPAVKGDGNGENLNPEREKIKENIPSVEVVEESEREDVEGSREGMQGWRREREERRGLENVWRE